MFEHFRFAACEFFEYVHSCEWVSVDTAVCVAVVCLTADGGNAEPWTTHWGARCVAETGGSRVLLWAEDCHWEWRTQNQCLYGAKLIVDCMQQLSWFSNLRNFLIAIQSDSTVSSVTVFAHVDWSIKTYCDWAQNKELFLARSVYRGGGERGKLPLFCSRKNFTMSEGKHS